MKKQITKLARIIIGLLIAATLLSGCATNKRITIENPDSADVRVHLYGETHGKAVIMEYEVAEWQRFYNEEGLRHLFLENSYAAVAYLNQWMHEDNDDILLQLYDDWNETAIHVEATLDFFRAIKETCPETVFHGTDVGHQFASNGARYLAELEAQGLKDSEAYRLTEENNQQAMEFYEKGSDAIRENYMVQNFIREFGSLPPDTKIMGIYGSAHVCYEMDMSGTVPSMIRQLITHYGNIFTTTNISALKPAMEPVAVDEMIVNGKTYTASCFGEQDLTAFFKDYKSRTFWRLENAYADFSVYPTNGNYLPQSNYPVMLQPGDVWMIIYEKTDGFRYVEYMVNFGDSDGAGYITYEVILSE